MSVPGGRTRHHVVANLSFLAFLNTIDVYSAITVYYARELDL